MKRESAAPKGTLIVVPGPHASIGWRKHSRAPIIETPIELTGLRGGEHVAEDFNDAATAFVKTVGRYMHQVARIIFYEREPKSSNEAHVQNMIGKVVLTFGARCGLEVRVVNEISFSALMDGRETEIVTPQKVGLVAERDRRGGNTLCYCALKPWENEARNSDYIELLTAIIERRLHWSEYGLLRQEAENSPLWLRTLGAGT